MSHLKAKNGFFRCYFRGEIEKFIANVDRVLGNKTRLFSVMLEKKYNKLKEKCSMFKENSYIKSHYSRRVSLCSASSTGGTKLYKRN